MIASGADLDNLAQNIMLNFQREETARFPMTDIDKMASQYLSLSVRYTPLSDDGKLLGLTTYDRTKVNIFVDGHQETLSLDGNTVLLDRSFLRQWPRASVRERLGKQRRFTLAHECAHQILFRLEPENIKSNIRNQYSERRLYDCRDLKTKEDWNEWQANTLGAALLMPRIHILRYFDQYQRNEPLISFGGKYAKREQVALSCLTSFFGVSKRMMEIRLTGLGLLQKQPRWLFHDPTKIYAGDDFEL